MSGIAAVVHYYWLVKSDIRQPLLYAFLVGSLLLFRVGASVGKRLSPPPSRKRAPALASES